DLGEWNMMLCNLHFLEMVPDNEKVNVIIILDKEKEGDTRLLELKQGGSIELNLTDINPEWTDGELNTGDGEQLLEFLNWGADTYPAKRYNVHLADHGGGWRGMCWDVLSNDHLDLPEIGNTMDAFREHIGRNIEVLSTEACLVGMVEFAYELRSSCNYFIGGSTYGWGAEAEPENEKWEAGNWQYDACWGKLSENPEMTGEQFALAMGDTFSPYGPWRAPPYIPKEGYSDVFGVFNLSNVEPLVEALDLLASELISKVTGVGQAVNQALLINTVIGHPEYQSSELYTEYFSHQMEWVGYNAVYTNYDVYDFAYQLSKASAGTLRSSHAQTIMNAVDDLMLLYRRTMDDGGHPDAHGVSIYIPYRSSSYNSAYEDIQFAEDTQWDEFIRAVHWT
ncbi:MAG: clostripain-related cysteine peptidase, partial [Candidatus Thermoplasmatota archaeon]|nr:clostripain-related cysteine peptidase [Candidatus Thermoplasmatota archaeon]